MKLAGVDQVDHDVHRVREVLAGASGSLPAVVIRKQARLSHERTYAALVRMHGTGAARIVTEHKQQDAGREWELM